jgi:hypothetical protein
MKSNSKRALIVSLFFTLGLMVAPLGASEPRATATCETAACDGASKVEATKSDVCVEKTEMAAEVEATVAPAKTNAELVADARKSKARTVRAKQAKNRREWVKFAFGKNETTGIDKEFFFGPSTRAEFVESSRQWLDFAFGDTE